MFARGLLPGAIRRSTVITSLTGIVLATGAARVSAAISGDHDRPVRTWIGPLGIEFVWVGAPGNKDDEPGLNGHRFGGVNYGYWISRTEITNTHYTAFLNAVATKGSVLI